MSEQGDEAVRWTIDQEVIERNSVRCDACGDEIESTYRHDFKACKCGRVLVDGGLDYRKVGWQGGGGPGFTDTSIYDVWEVDYDDQMGEVARRFKRSVTPTTTADPERAALAEGSDT